MLRRLRRPKIGGTARIGTLALGALLAGTTSLADWAGVLAPLDRYFYDLRAAHCQYFTPPPSDQIVEVDIDDGAIEAIGRWPWPRRVLADIMEEIAAAGPKAIATDILFTDPQKVEFVPMPGPTPVTPPQPAAASPPADTPPAPGPAPEPAVGAILANTAGQPTPCLPQDDDRAFAESIGRMGNVLIPFSLTFKKPAPPLPFEVEARRALEADPECEVAAVVAALKAGPREPCPTSRSRRR